VDPNVSVEYISESSDELVNPSVDVGYSNPEPADQLTSLLLPPSLEKATHW
jgi:hypothetical protein